MAKPISNNVVIKGSTLLIGIEFPPVDGIQEYNFDYFKSLSRVAIKYYIINTSNSISVLPNLLYKVLESTDPNYSNHYALTIDTTNLKTGVLMVELTLNVPAHNSLPERKEIIRCSTGVSIID